MQYPSGRNGRGHRKQRRTLRRANATLESVMIVFILFLTTLAVFQFGFAMVIRQATVHAATVTAREAAKGADTAEITSVANAVLGPHGIEVGPGMSLVVERPPASPEFAGNLNCDPPTTPLDPGRVRVTVCVSLNQRPFINPLGAVGVSFIGKSYQASAVAQLESTP